MNLNMLGVTTTNQSNHEISAAMQRNNHCLWSTKFLLKTQAVLNEIFKLKPQQVHPCTVCI